MPKSRCFIAISLAASLSLLVGCDGGGSSDSSICQRACEKMDSCDANDYQDCYTECRASLEANGSACSDAVDDYADCLQAHTCEDLGQVGVCDEEMLAAENSCPNEVCGPNDFECNDGSCIDGTWMCDGECDCGDCEDEDGCR